MRDFTTQLTGLPTEVNAILSNGFALVDRECAAFFDALERGRQVSEFGAAQLAAIATAASAVMAIAGAGTPAIAYTTAGLGLASVTVTNIQRFALLTDFPDELQRLVVDAQASYRTAVQAEMRAAQAGSVTPGGAYAAVVGYARLCTLPGMRRLAREALAAAQTTAIPASTSRVPTAEQARALGIISTEMGFAQPLTVIEAGALLRFATTGANDPDGMALRTLLGDRLWQVLNQPAMTPRDPARYDRGIAALRVLAVGFAGLREATSGGPAADGSVRRLERLPGDVGGAVGGLAIPSIRVMR